MPAANPLRLIVALTEPVLVPDTGLRANHAALSLTVHDKVPPPVLLILNVFAAGFPPPAVPINPRLVVLSPMAGARVVDESARVTGTCFVTPPAVTLPVPL